MTIPKRYALLTGSKFTSTAPFLGWRHFHVEAVRKKDDGWEAEVVSSVESTKRAWVDVATLLDKAQWHTGWTLLKDLAR